MHHPPWRRVARQVAGWTLFAIGVIGLLVPILPHTLPLAAGALLLAPYVRIFRRFSAWLHRKFPRWRGPLRHFRDFKHPPRPAAGESPCKPPEAGAVCAANNAGEAPGETRK